MRAPIARGFAPWGLLACLGCQATPSFPAASEDTPSSSSAGNESDPSGRFGGRFPDDTYVTAGDFEGALKLPGTDASVRIGGFVRAEASFDTDNAGSGFATILPTIPLDGTPDDGTEQVQFHVRNSRLNVDYRDLGSDKPDFRVFVEFDFFGSGDDFGNTYGLRLRHAAAQYGNFFAGQWWSYFVDVAAFPETADFIGPLAVPAVRNPGLRYSRNLGQGAIRAGFGLEDPAGDLSGDPDALASDAVPNVTGYVESRGDTLRVRLAGLALRLDSTTDEEWAGGGNLTGRWSLPFLHARDNLTFGLQGGSGFAHFYTGFSNRGLDGVVGPDGSIEARDLWGGYLAYQHWWTDTVRSTVAWGTLTIDGPRGASSGDYEDGTKTIANIFWSPEARLTVGIELIHATVETVGDGDGDGTRFFVSTRFDL